MTTKRSRQGSRRRFLRNSLYGAGSLALASMAGSPLISAVSAAPTRTKLSKKLTLKFATIVAESFPYVDGARRWKQLIEDRTAGTVEVQIYHTAQLGDERTINEGVLAGSIHAGIGAGAWAGFVPAYNIVELPFLLKDLNHMYVLADGELGEKIAQQAETKGFKVLAYYSAGALHLQTRTKPIRTLADIKGLKIRVIENKALVEGFKALSAVPTPLPYPQIYTALQQGTVDGTGNDILSVTTLKLYEVAKYFTMANYAAEPRPVIMSKSFFDSLPADLRTILVETARESAVYERKVFEDKTAGGFEEAKKNGMTILELSDRQKWVDAVRPVWDDFAKNVPGAAELIKAVQRTY